MKHVFVDFEMNEINSQYKAIKRQCNSEIVEIGAVMLDEQYNEISEFKEYVRPQYNDEICGGCARVTDITYETVADARSIESVYAAFADWCASAAGSHNYQIYSWSLNDYVQLVREMECKKFGSDHPETEWMLDNWIDYQQEYTDLIGYTHVLSLQTALGSLGETFSGKQHDALFDARNTAHIFVIAQDEEKFEKLVGPLIEALKPPEPTTFKLGDALKAALAAAH